QRTAAAAVVRCSRAFLTLRSQQRRCKGVRRQAVSSWIQTRITTDTHIAAGRYMDLRAGPIGRTVGGVMKRVCTVLTSAALCLAMTGGVSTQGAATRRAQSAPSAPVKTGSRTDAALSPSEPVFTLREVAIIT